MNETDAILNQTVRKSGIDYSKRGLAVVKRLVPTRGFFYQKTRKRKRRKTRGRKALVGSRAVGKSFP